MNVEAKLYLDLLDELYEDKATSQHAVQSYISKITSKCDVQSTITSSDLNIAYSSQIIQILAKIKALLKFDEQFDPDNLATFITINKGINLVLNYGICTFSGYYFKISEKTPNVDPTMYPVELVKFLLNYLNFNSIVRLNSDLNAIKLLLYGGFGLLYHLKYVHQDERLEVIIDEKLKSRLSELSLVDAIQTLMKINTTVNTKQMSEIVTDKLIFLLQTPNGLYSFVNVIVKSRNDDQPVWKRGEIASRIISAKGHSVRFYENMVGQIFNYLEDPSAERDQEFIPVYVVTLSRIYFISDGALQSSIRHKLFGNLDKLANPPDLLTGIIVMDDSEFRRTIELIHKTFCGTSACSMKTVLLIPYISILFKVYALLPDEIPEKKYINSIIVQCLTNRSDAQLYPILECLLLNHNLLRVQKIHKRIGVKIQSGNRITFIITPDNQFYNPVESFIKILRNSANNLFIYATFLVALKLFETLDDESENKSSELLEIEDDLNGTDDFVSEHLMKNFNKKFLIINLLNEIIMIKEFHSQISENPIEILNFIKTFLSKQISAKQVNENLLIIIFSLIKIFGVEWDRHQDQMEQIMKLLELLKKRDTLNDFVVKQINLLLFDIKGNGTSTSPETGDYQTGLALCNESESFLQVYGIHTLIKLARAQDENILANKYEILLLGLRILKNDQDSYTYLNCINLMVELAPMLKREFFDTLTVEFDNENSDLDYRLKIGEVIVKVTEALGTAAYKYKDLLINCFMKGSRNKSDEFRTSSLSNLGTICRLFSYQVHHFFQELMLLTESIITNDTYLPARRAVIMVLSHLLFGIDNILNFQEYLIPIYRALKTVVNTESDEQILLHAQLGLDHIKTKTKEFLVVEPKMEREIKIFGIKDEVEEITTKKITDLN